MRTFTAILGTVFVLVVSVAAMENTPSAQTPATVQAGQHQHGDAAKCCDTAGGMCARDGKDARADAKCCKKDSCCKDDCCKDGTCDKDCTCECCKDGACGTHKADPNAPAREKGSCCTKVKSSRPMLVASH